MFLLLGTAGPLLLLIVPRMTDRWTLALRRRRGVNER